MINWNSFDHRTLPLFTERSIFNSLISEFYSSQSLTRFFICLPSPFSNALQILWSYCLSLARVLLLPVHVEAMGGTSLTHREPWLAFSTILISSRPSKNRLSRCCIVTACWTGGDWNHRLQRIPHSQWMASDSNGPRANISCAVSHWAPSSVPWRSVRLLYFVYTNIIDEI